MILGSLALGAALAVAITGGAGAQDTPAKPLKIVVVNLTDCMSQEKSDFAKELRGKLEAQSKEAKEEIGKLKKKADELKQRANAVEEGSDFYIQLVKDYNLAEAQIKIESEVTQRMLLAAQYKVHTQMYNEARAMVQKIGEEMKADLVLRADDGEPLNDKQEMTMQRNLVRIVLYNSPAVDITSTVIARLNEDYKKRQKK
jgi:Skp family chaperone for outer membrane proteins